MDINNIKTRRSSPHKIISWNCNGTLKKKLDYLLNLDGDIYVVQECGDLSKNEFIRKNYNYHWSGENKNKGIGIFSKPHIKLELLNWENRIFKEYLPVLVNGKFILLGVWACDPYIFSLYSYYLVNRTYFNKNMIITGDFNSNSIWDKEYKAASHTNLMNEWDKLGLKSCYHLKTSEEPGFETDYTFYMYRKELKKYHIDYSFCREEIFRDFTIYRDSESLSYSDHFPIILDVDLE